MRRLRKTTLMGFGKSNSSSTTWKAIPPNLHRPFSIKTVEESYFEADRATKGFWKTIDNQKGYFDWLAKQLQIQKPEDWYQVKLSDVIERGGFGILSLYGHSLIKALESIYPDYPWKPWYFSHVSRGFWSDIENQRKFITWLENKLNIQTVEDWYRVKNSDVREYGGHSLLNYYDDSVIKLVQAIYPNQQWLEWRFSQASRNFWNDIKNQQRYFDWLGTKLDVKKPEDWYNITTMQIKEHYGSGLLEKYGGSLSAALSAAYSNIMWEHWNFKKTSHGFWNDIQNQRRYFDKLAQLLNIKDYEDWYSITLADIHRVKGTALLNTKYGNSLSKALQTIYPEKEWKLWRFKQVSRGFWDNENNARDFLSSLANQLEISHLDEWYSISQRHFVSTKGGSTLLNKNKGLHQLLSKLYPEKAWNFSVASSPSKAQLYLYRLIQSIFPNEKVYLDEKYSNLIYENSKLPMRLDVLVPSKKLALEYQGQQHYTDHFLYGSPKDQQTRDEEKRQRCQKEGITLIEIPYWWDNKKSSLLATLAKTRADLVTDTLSGIPIPENPPARLSGFMTTPLLSSEEKWNFANDPSGWWISEKLNGLRVCWDGKTSMFLQNRKKISLPTFFIQKLPLVPLDGVLWSESIPFEQCVDSILSGELQIWSKIDFYVWDLPTFTHLKFEQRMAELHKLAAPNLKPISIVECKSIEHLKESLNQSQEKGGNGLLLRKPKSYYYEKSVQKVAEIFEENEALVVKHIDQHLLCKLENNKEILIPVSSNLPSIGSVITYRKTPEDTIFQRQRKDLSWKGDELSYFFDNGKISGLPKCRGCRKQFQRNEWRVYTIALYHPHGTGPYPGKCYFCCNVDCIQQGIKRVLQKSSELPPFSGKIGLQNRIIKKHDPNYPTVDGAEIVVL